MKVVQINCASYGSTGNIAKAIHTELIKNGDESYVFYGWGKSDDKNIIRIENYFGLHIHSVLSKAFGRQGYFSCFATIKLIRRLKKIKPDIIHLHNLHGCYLNLPMLFKYLKKSDARIVLTLHDCWLFTGKCPYFTVADCYKWKEECGNCTQLEGYPESKADTTRKCLADKKKWLSGFGDRMKIIAVSNWLRDTARQSFLSQYSIETIYNGIDTNIFKPIDGTKVREKYKLGNKFVILGVANVWDKRKGLDEFLELSKEISQDEIIVLVGLTQEQVDKMPDNIVGITRTESKTELAELYSAADVFVNTSKEETFGIVTAEAMACATPVVVYNSTACGEIVHKDFGLVRNDDMGLREAIDKIKNVNFKQIRLELPKKFKKETMVRRYIYEYNEIEQII